MPVDRILTTINRQVGTAGWAEMLALPGLPPYPEAAYPRGDRSVRRRSRIPSQVGQCCIAPRNTRVRRISVELYRYAVGGGAFEVGQIQTA